MWNRLRTDRDIRAFAIALGFVALAAVISMMPASEVKDLAFVLSILGIFYGPSFWGWR